MSTIESVSHEQRIFPPPAHFVAQANVKKADFDAMNAEAARDFAGFWARLARQEIAWQKPFTRVLDESNAPFYKWFDDGLLNVSYNCLDRNLANGNAEKIAIIFEADDGTVTKVTYRDLYHRVCRLANGLKSLGISKGDRTRVAAGPIGGPARTPETRTRACQKPAPPPTCGQACPHPAVTGTVGVRDDAP